jgi:hypothetical protein
MLGPLTGDVFCQSGWPLSRAGRWSTDSPDQRHSPGRRIGSDLARAPEAAVEMLRRFATPGCWSVPGPAPARRHRRWHPCLPSSYRGRRTVRYLGNGGKQREWPSMGDGAVSGSSGDGVADNGQECTRSSHDRRNHPGPRRPSWRRETGQVAHPGGRAVHVRVNQGGYRRDRHNWAGTWGILARSTPQVPGHLCGPCATSTGPGRNPTVRGACRALLHGPEMGHSTHRPDAEAVSSGLPAIWGFQALSLCFN